MESAVHNKDFHINLNQELYEEGLEHTRGLEERDMTDVDEEELEEEQDPHVRTTSSVVEKLRKTQGNNIFSF